MDVYTDNRTLFLADVDFKSPDSVVSVPVIDGYTWSISGKGRGFLMTPDETMHCRFDLNAGTLVFEPRGEAIQAPGLTASLVQEMGERYAQDVLFTDEEQKQYDAHVLKRDNTKKVHDRQVWNTLKGVIQLEQKDGAWLAHVDSKTAKELTGVESHHICSKADGIALFNEMCSSLHAAPLRDPTGYMALSGNVYEYLQREYRNQYEDVLQGIDNQMIDGTGYGVAHVLETLQSTVRKDVSEYLPKGQNFGDLRFVAATEERKDAVRNFVKCRVSKTLTYEKKRSYEKATLERTHDKFVEAGKHLGDVLSQTPRIPDLGISQ